MLESYSAITGIEIDAAELLKKGERIFNMARIMNIRCGFNDRKYDRAPERWFEPLKGTDGNDYPMMDYFGTKAVTREDTENALDDFYDEGYSSADLYYNLANAHFRNKDIASAILYYEKAKKMKPNDADIIHNLGVANSRITDKIEQLPVIFYKRWWNNLKY